MTDISTWLLGVYDRREKVAREATPGPWRADGNHIFDGEGKKLFARGTHMRPSATEVFALFANMEQVITHDPEKTLARLAALKEIVKWHQNWPVLLSKPPTIHPTGIDDLHTSVIRMTRQMEWITHHEYEKRFGHEPPTAPILRLLAAAESHEPGYRQEWAVES